MGSTVDMARRRRQAIERLRLLRGAGDPSLTAPPRLMAHVTGAGAAVPVRAAYGTVLGTLCAWDTRVRRLTAEQLDRHGDVVDQLAARIGLTRIASEPGIAASHDALTGVCNRLLLPDRLAQALTRSRRRGHDILVALVDIDGFRRINEVHGHDAGDDVLMTLGRRLIDHIRSEDTVARLGGDEFVVVAECAPSTIVPGAFAARLQALLSAPIFYAGADRDLGVTVGAAHAEPGDDVRSALARAHRDMCARKPARVGASSLPSTRTAAT